VPPFTEATQTLLPTGLPEQSLQARPSLPQVVLLEPGEHVPFEQQPTAQGCVAEHVVVHV
jgi:hypothetical protein